MNEKEREEKSYIIDLLLLDYVHLNDLFFDLHNENLSQAQLLEVQGQLNSLNIVFALGKVVDLDHQSVLEDIAFDILTSTRGGELSKLDRAKLIFSAWHQAFLVL